MAETFPTPEQISTSDAEALSGTTDQRTQIAYLPEGTSPTSTPTLTQQDNRVQHAIRRAVATAVAGMAFKTGTLEVGAFPRHYLKADNTEAHFEGGTIALTASETNSVYILHSTNALAKSTSGFPEDKTTFTPVAEYICDASDIVTGDAAADRRGLALYYTSSAALTGISASSLRIDNDATVAGDRTLIMQLTVAWDVGLRWVNASGWFALYGDLGDEILGALNASRLLISDTEVIGADGDLAAASIASDQLYVFGANGATANGIKLTAMGGSGPPSSGAHTKGELALDSGGVLYGCTAAGEPGTWEQVGKQDDAIVLSVGDGSGTQGNAVTCSIQAKDAFGNNLSEAVIFDIYLMDDTDGGADAPNCSAFTVTAGTQLREVVANKHYRVKSNASGLLTFTVINSIADQVFVLTAEPPGHGRMDCSDRGTLTWS